MRLLLAASEVTGFAKTGGLADVAAALPRALARRGHECCIVMPLYQAVRTGKVAVVPTGHAFKIPVGTRAVPGTLWAAALPDSRVPVYFVEQANYFERDDPSQGRGLYHFTLPGGHRRDYPDNGERYAFFCRAVPEAARLLNFRPDVLHANDWQTGLIPAYLRESRRAAASDRIRTLFTIHNIAYQGVFPARDFGLTGLPPPLFNHRELEFFGQMNYLKAGIVFADAVNAVSPTYAREIQTADYGCGLEGVLAERAEKLFGIVNGVDYADWDPRTDPNLAANYDADSVAEKKPLCKAALQRRCGLPEEPAAPLLGVVARLVAQKGIDLIVQTADSYLGRGAQLVALGNGDPGYERQLQEVRQRHPDRVHVYLGFDEALAHQIEAGADLFLMPSRYEPCGLNQMYSLKYGTVPVVRATGGLADTITDATPENLANGTATGFQFGPYAPDALRDALARALDLYRDSPDGWLRLVRTGMRQDWSWDRSAGDYERLYEKLVGKRF